MIAVATARLLPTSIYCEGPECEPRVQTAVFKIGSVFVARFGLLMMEIIRQRNTQPKVAPIGYKPECCDDKKKKALLAPKK